MLSQIPKDGLFSFQYLKFLWTPHIVTLAVYILNLKNKTTELHHAKNFIQTILH